MRAVHFAVVAAFVFSLLVAQGANGQDGAAQAPYLFDLMKQPAYRKAWANMVNGETVPLWISKFGVSYNATGAPVEKVSVGGEPYTLAWICEPHNCGDSEAYVLFSPQARQAWALLITEGNRRQWLGDPDATIKNAIESGVQ